LGRSAKLADVTNLDQNPRPEARADPWQALNDARLGQGEKSTLDLLFETLAANEDSVQLLGELGHQASSRLSAGHDNGLRLGSHDELLDPCLRLTHAMGGTKQINQSLGPGLPELWRARVPRKQSRAADGVQPIIQCALERRPVRGQQCPHSVSQPIRVLTQVGIVAVQELQLCTGGACLAQPDQPVGMSASDVRQYESILRIGLGITRIEIAGASHRQAGYVSNTNRGIPAQLQQQSSGPTGLIHNDRGLVRTRPQNQQSQRAFLIGDRL